MVGVGIAVEVDMSGCMWRVWKRTITKHGNKNFHMGGRLQHPATMRVILFNDTWVVGSSSLQQCVGVDM